ncbi:alpha/beta hydrolase [Hanamia caeni]|jgi:esterase/lipase superfamily enzyme|uniref:Alpha/beta hydrolase n=1 Tax=Hanamia caeni TaxID=2294116 RepID=A0A3M9NQC5_9BACT|nr:alpha/beta hydrolase [Hanamia caeni]RNI39874.1 alpha/beta hydrolase [Hanamia caeni]
MLHYIITNREIIPDEKGEFIKADGGETPSENLRFGTFDSDIYNATKDSRLAVTLFPDPKAPNIASAVTDAEIQPYSASLAHTPTDTLIGSKKFFTELYQNMKAVEGDLLFFVHGFHTDLASALNSICKLEKTYINSNSPIKHIVAFTWPARNEILRYRDDAKDAELSGFSLARCYLMLIDFFRAIFGADTQHPLNDPCNNNIHLLAHSMGNRVIEAMMTELLAQRDSSITAVFKEIILAASDVDWQVFEEPRSFNMLSNIGERTTVYFNTKDLALFISETTKNAYNRLGKFGFRDYNKIPAHIYSVDCTGINDQSGLESNTVQHWYYVESETVISDITETLKSKRVEEFIGLSRTAIPSVSIQFRLII